MEVIAGRRLKTTWKVVRACLFINSILAIFLFTLFLGVIGFARLQGAPPLSVPQSTLFYADDGSLIGETHKGQIRYWVPLKEISPALVQATISVEDRNFYAHHGFDMKRIGAAALADLKAMAKVQGASTISQQYARNLFLGHEKTWNRKFREALYTMRLELNYNKDEILEGYLNTIYYGHGNYGVEAASRYYFCKKAADLSVGEASLLAGIPKGPGRYSPFANIKNAQSRQLTVLKAMKQNGFLTAEEMDRALAEKLRFSGKHVLKEETVAPYYQDAVKKELAKLPISESVLKMGGLKVYTTLNPKMQKIAEEQVKAVINPKTELQVGFMAMDPRNGEVKALIGGRNYQESPFNRATQSERQPGSTMKPFLYYTALKQGFTPSTELLSEPTTFKLEDGKKTYTPSNYNNYYPNSTINMAQALALSDNIYAVKTMMFIGEDEMIKTAQSMGIKSRLARFPSLALGSSNVRLSEMVNAYGMFANGGKQIEPIFIQKVVDHKGEVIYEHFSERKQILDKDLTFVMTHLMTGMFDERLNDYTTVTGRSIIKNITRYYAGKSGTTQADSWMIGYAPQLAAGVWTGYDRGKNLDLTEEKSYAKNIWVRFMEEALEDQPVEAFKPTGGSVGVYINPDNGKLATEDCPVKRLTYYVKGTEPTEVCTLHLDSHPAKEAKKKQKEKAGKKDGSWFKWLPWF